MAPSENEFDIHDLHLDYSIQQSYQNGRTDKGCPGQVKLKKFIITKPLLHEMLKGLIQEKEDQNYEH